MCAISKNTVEDKKKWFFFQVKHEKKRRKEKCGKKRKWRRMGVQATPFLRAKMCCSTTRRFFARERCITRPNFIFFYLGLIKQCFYLVLNIWYLFNLVLYFISPEPNEGPTSGKEREGKRERWRPNWISPLWPCS